MSEESGLSSAFPPPPKEFELFTNANLEAYRQDPASVGDLVARAMQPPDTPTKAYSVFGATWQIEDKLPTLQDSGLEQLYPDGYDLVLELKKLSRSLMLNYLELITIMSIAPEQFPGKVEHLRLIMINMHHLINSYRPHQTRESLIVVMEQQIARRTRETEDIELVTSTAREQIAKYQTLESQIGYDAEMSTNTNGTLAEPHQSNSLARTVDQDLHLFDMLTTIV
ncbi:Mediator of RNA polymerase II transcription subunit 7 [Taphrina deformans PYCC 5710]|uniref:Mediator of RNA polymerase II transcription subunit 7 n=1 Tax=Taphrina deformans (strain PYCC 5710 / ATCC 11124 / CBS 356.35 / IMI 108563 / JCM 9778 / NBRC 8474) TaxID=1097556 RepID=R4X872_TAPDE|nr:Mediator of RNA polymerase II transcription subunit 7 [Taphrina deformans PYCC 5710]|eukprot:CCG81734.1 Mediator of RNA polymerase II transcription subunit 7 [Taphrina deformans PYCC 5710]